MKILVLNAGSSSQKSCLYNLRTDELPAAPPQPVWAGQIEWRLGAAGLKTETDSGVTFESIITSQSRQADTAHLLQTLWLGPVPMISDPQEIDVVGHRVVHGGDRYRHSVIIDAAVKAEIEHLSTFAPIHNPANLAGIEAVEQLLGSAPQVAVFDTAFHTTLPAAAYAYPLPKSYLDQGIRRYGFHGISHQYCAQRAAQLLGRNLEDFRLIIAHLGNGCSLTAVKQGQSIDTTMGFTPLEGLMMGSRSGSVDPGILLHLLRQGMTVDELDQLLNKQSGLLGLSGISNDMRDLLNHCDPQAELALSVYIHRLRSGIGSMLASLGGLDVLVFTAGVGENAAQIRAAACEPFAFLGLHIDPHKNVSRPRDLDIATPQSKVRVLVIHTQEDWAIAQDCHRLLTVNNRNL